MNYFTTAIFVQLQECDTPAQSLAANHAWELAVANYHQHLALLLPNLRGGVRRLASGSSLHDAAVLDIGTAGLKWTILLREEQDPQLLSLTYSLVAEPIINRSAIPAEHCSPQAAWLYDEFGCETATRYHPRQQIERKADSVQQDGEWKPIYTHAILLSNGWEIRLRFHRVSVTRTTSLFPSTRIENTLSYSA